MKIIHIHHPYKNNEIPNEDVVLVLGFFDGIHLGHQKVILEGKRLAEQKKIKLALMTFNQHPSIVFKKEKSIYYLTTLKQKEQILEKLGVDILYVVEFTSSFAALAPQEFVDQYIVGLHAKIVVAGFDYTYGPKDQANMEQLADYSKNRFEIVKIGKQMDNGKKISSTRIREAMDKGDMEEVTSLLGQEFQMEGTVIHGEARGRQLGFPTANLKYEPKIYLPREGVYAVRFKVDSKWYQGMASIGRNETFGDNRKLTVEVYILDFSKDIYGENVVVEWTHFLRGNIKFNSIESLIGQLKKDERDTADYFSKLDEK